MLEPKGLGHSLDAQHVNPHFSTNELGACEEGRNPLFTLLAPPLLTGLMESFPPYLPSSEAVVVGS